MTQPLDYATPPSLSVSGARLWAAACLSVLGILNSFVGVVAIGIGVILLPPSDISISPVRGIIYVAVGSLFAALGLLDLIGIWMVLRRRTWRGILMWSSGFEVFLVGAYFCYFLVVMLRMGFFNVIPLLVILTVVAGAGACMISLARIRDRVRPEPGTKP